MIAVLYFLMFIVFALIMLATSSLSPTPPNMDPEQHATFKRSMRLFLLAYPFLGAIFGWIFTVLSAALYNALTPRLGGLLLEVRESRAIESSPTA